MPQATVKLAPTRPIASSPTASIASAPIKGGVASQVLADDEAEEEGGITPFATICLVLAIAVLAIELLTSQRVITPDDNGFPVPKESNRYHTQNAATGDWSPNFSPPEAEKYSPTSVDSPDIGNNDFPEGESGGSN